MTSPEHEEGPCPKCSRAQQMAKGDYRKCSSCEFIWKVPTSPLSAFDDANRIGG